MSEFSEIEEEAQAIEFDLAALQAAADVGRARSDPRIEDEEIREGGRILLGGFSLNMELHGKKDPGFHYRWFVDRRDRLQQALMAGYRPVLLGDGETDFTRINNDNNLADQGQWICMKTGNHDGAQPEFSYLMAIKKEWHEEDQAKKQGVVDQLDEAIHGGNLGKLARPEMETQNQQGESVVYSRTNMQNEFKR